MQSVKRFFQNCLHVRVLAPLLATLVWSVSTLYLPSNVFSGTLSIAFLLTVPGYVLYCVIAGYPRGQLKSRTLLYSVGLSLAALMLVGLALNQLWLLLGHRHPLTVPHLVPAVSGFTVFFAILTAFRQKSQNLKRYAKYAQISTWRRNGPLWKTVGWSAFLLLLPVLAIGGAIILNNNGSNILALTAVGLVALTMLGLAWTNKPHHQALYPLGLFSIAATLLLGTSMRGWEITGHDVMQEFQVFQLTSQHSLWSMSFYQDAYTACLSITILPTILQKLSGLYDPYIFKVVFQLVFALMAPLLYSGLRTYVPRKTAFLAALVFMTFPTFLTDMMMLNRQEVAMMLFALGIMAALDSYLSKPKRHILLIIFLGGMVLSHYSTSYVAVSVLIVTVLLGVGLWVLRPLLRKLKLHGLAKGPNFSIFPPYVVALLLLMIIGWSGLATNTAGNIGQTITGVGNSLIRLVNPRAAPPQTISSVTIGGSTFIRYQEYIQKTLPLPAKDYYPDSRNADYTPAEIEQKNAPVTPFAQRLGLNSGILDHMYGAIRSGYVAALTVLLALGLAIMLWKRSATQLPQQYALLGVSWLVVVALQMVLPSGAIDYGITRVIQQGLVVLALPAVIGIVWLLGNMHLNFGSRFRLLAVGLVTMFLVMSSWLPTLTGGFKPALAFANSGFYYEAYYTHPEEIQADKWLVANAPKGSRVYADEFARRKMITYAGIFPQPTVVPAAIPVDSYVYLSVGDTTFNEIPVYYNGNLIFYSVPTYFLNTHKSLVYNSGGVMIYR